MSTTGKTKETVESAQENIFSAGAYQTVSKRKNKSRAGRMLWGWLLPDVPGLIRGIVFSFRRTGHNLKMMKSVLNRRNFKAAVIDYESIKHMSHDEQYDDILVRCGFNMNLTKEEIAPHYKRITKNAFWSASIFSLATVFSAYLFITIPLSNMSLGMKIFLLIHATLFFLTLFLRAMQSFWHWSQLKNKRYVPFMVWMKGQS